MKTSTHTITLIDETIITVKNAVDFNDARDFYREQRHPVGGYKWLFFNNPNCLIIHDITNDRGKWVSNVSTYLPWHRIAVINTESD